MVAEYIIIQIRIAGGHGEGYTGTCAHIEDGFCEGIQQYGIAVGAHKIRHSFIRAFRICGESVLLPDFHPLSALVKAGKLFAEAIEGFIDMHIKRVICASHLTGGGIAGKTKRHRLIFLVNIQVLDIFSGKHSAIQHYRKLPRAFAEGKRKARGAYVHKQFILGYGKIPELWKFKYGIQSQILAAERKHLKPENIFSGKGYPYGCLVAEICIGKKSDTVIVDAVLTHDADKILVFYTGRNMIAFSAIIINIYNFCHRV
ncbi:hypothetical protein BRYFOR_05133 [Marvinbryantia formatexigens DSM 14469]|uniref:Uncharacterized protein n=1 Tax=Marvinbryantia formatexigens DSM 14469 TaxID=478749 RepID=C6L943_9FIRM|nr:hypothetical protein BRYFOR_05133 [Marvinbryantia formatexigens DSM 14469]